MSESDSETVKISINTQLNDGDDQTSDHNKQRQREIVKDVSTKRPRSNRVTDFGSKREEFPSMVATR